MVTRLSRIEGLLGTRLDSVAYDGIAALVGNAEAAENENLDYKQAHYAMDAKGKEELAKDVTAFANHTGGLLVLGMAEVKGVPTKVFDVDLDDAHLRHIRQVIAANTAPPVRYEAIPVHKPGSPDTGFLLLAVPRSPYGPHAVTAPPTKPSTDCLRYPRRGDSKTEWLTETDVATAYRARFAAGAERDQRMAYIEEEVVDALVRRTTPHLIATLVPEQAGDMVIDSDRFTRYEQELLATQLFLGQGSRNFGRVSVGPRRLIVTEGGSWYSARAELHRDGSGTIALPLNGRVLADDDEEAQMLTTEPGEVVYPLLCALPFLAAHARDRAAASGPARARVVLVSDMAEHPTQARFVDFDRPAPVPFRVDRIDPVSGRRAPMTPDPCNYATAHAGVLLDELADLGRGLLQATAALADELLQAYGYPETGLIDRTGQVQPHLFSQRNSRAVEQWARQRGLL
ncbi:hypothetical protein GCM10010372_83830 [Streptomyces tauricus]|uniref:AlbA family DNA-binding domain-containing protein n=1 Tax=Streptomyces tauricus TaxID=68274 RepID=UPI0016749CC6|nr:ATP-binding protein [Streptomyces tauricus]GHA72179.1 hypothetical protein GCM10010372_83830 [Streptomyces tauricus]